jgi:hypothetical protein
MIEEVIYKESLFINEYTGDVDLIQKHIDHLLEFDPGRVMSNMGGYQSHNISFGFHDLIKFALNSLELIKVEARLSNFWVNINKKSHSNDPHIHGINVWSAVYYHKVCCNIPKINFHHLVPTVIDQTFEFTPKEKQMIFFKGEIPHSVSPCTNQGHERISIAFNFHKL